MSDQQWDDETIERTVDTLKFYTGTGAYLGADEVKQLMRDVRDELTTERDALAAEVERLKAQIDAEGMLEFINDVHREHIERLQSEVERLRAGSYQPVPDGVYPRPNWDGNGETILEVSYDGSELEEWHSSNPSDKEEIGLPDEPRLRLCQWQPAQDTQPTGERSE